MQRFVAFVITLFALVGFTRSAEAATDYGTQSFGGANLTLASGDRICGALTNIGTLSIPNGVTVGVCPGATISVTANKILVTGTLDGSGAGSARQSGTGKGGDGLFKGTGNTKAGGGGGGGYGGAGGAGGGVSSGGGSAGATYGSATDATAPLGSGGGDGAGSNAANGRGGAGGASITLTATIAITINGAIKADGSSAANGTTNIGGGGGGSGGSIVLVGTVGGSGSVSARGGNGGNGATNDGSGGAGGGGRIKIFGPSDPRPTLGTSVSHGTAGINGAGAPSGAGADGTVNYSFDNSTTATTTTVTSDGTPALVGSTVTYTATVTAAGGNVTPVGTVAFTAEDTTSHVITSLGSGSVNASGVATVTNNTLPVGTYSIVASYTPTAGAHFGSSTSAGYTQGIQLAGTSVDLTTSGSPSTFGQSVTFTATVTSTSGTPTGTVTFTDTTTATTLGTQTLVAGVAAQSTSTLAVGNHTIKAQYNGDGTHAQASGTVAQKVDQATPTMSVSDAPNPSTFGQTVTITASVTSTVGTPTGTVTFNVDGVDIDVKTLSGGSASTTTATLDVAGSPHAVKATYGGDTNFSGKVATTSQTVNQASTKTGVATSASPVPPGTNVTFTATVTVQAPGAGTATGTVTFKDNGTTIGTGTLDSNGIATFQTTSLAVGSHPVTAEYGGDANYSGSASTAITEDVNQGAATVALTSSLNPSTFNASVTFSATVSGSLGTPTGTVTFTATNNATLAVTPLGAPTLTGGAASVSTSALPVGTYTITATYGGDTNYVAGSFGTVTQEVDQAATSTSVSVSPNPAQFAQQVGFTVTVTSTAGTPTGTVTISDNGFVIATLTLAGGTATYQTSSLLPGSHDIVADYLGDTSFAPSTSPDVPLTVGKAATTTTVVASSNPIGVSTNVTFTAHVAVVPPGGGTPTGSVDFFDGGTLLGTSTPDGAGNATFTTAALGVGTHSITATYNGDGGHSPSTSAPINETVSTTAATVALTSSPNPSKIGQSVTFTATVAGPLGAATGTVTFSEGGTTLGTSPIIGAVATLAQSFTTVGSHTIVATYDGNAQYAAGSTGTVVQVVNKAATVISIASSKNPSAVGEAVTFTATVVSTAAGAGGVVEFFDGSGSIGTAPASPDPGNALQSIATLTTSSLTLGTHSITAAYSGDQAHGASTTAADLTQVVQAAPAPTPDAGVDAGGDSGSSSSSSSSSSGGVVPDAGDGLTTGGGTGGCGCHTTSADDVGGFALVPLVGLALALMRRRRRG